VGALRAYEHKLREHSSMSSVTDEGFVDERHTRVAMRLEADVQVAAEKVASSKLATEAARKRLEEAQEGLRAGIDGALAAKDEAIADVVEQWEGALRVVGDAAATAAGLRPVPADDVPFLLAGDDAAAAEADRPVSREKHEAYAREAAEARQMLALADEDGGAALPALGADRLHSAAGLTMALEDRALESRSVRFGRSGGAHTRRGAAGPPPDMITTGLGSGMWSTTGPAMRSTTPAMRGGVVATPGMRTRPALEDRPAGGARGGGDEDEDEGGGLLATVSRVFDAATAASTTPAPRAEATRWDAGTWRPDKSGAYKGMDERERRRRQQAKAAAKPARAPDAAGMIAEDYEHTVSADRLQAHAGRRAGGRPPRRG